MNKLKVLGLCLTLCLMHHHGYAQQEIAKPNCKENLAIAIEYLERDIEYTDALKQEIYDSVATCLDNIENPETLHRIAKLIVQGFFPSKTNDDAFKMIQTASEQGIIDATFDLGVLHKKGQGCKIDFDKAMTCFKKSAKQGHQKAAYSMGYLYMKGLGSINQDYEQAVYWFKQSTYPMAKFWLGVCYYYGYGVVKDQNKALSYLSENDIINSKMLKEQFTKEKEKNAFNTVKQTSSTTNTASITELPEEKYNYFSVQEETIIGEWNGKIVEYDWSKKHIKRVIPIALSITEGAETPSFKLTIDKQSKAGELIFNDSGIYFKELSVSVQRLLADHPKQTDINYNIIAANLQETEHSGVQYLTGELETFVPELHEPTRPMDIILTKTSEISEDALQALAGQKGSFIKLYPVPFQQDLLIQYELETPATVSVGIQSYYGTDTTSIETNNNKQKGKHLHHFDSTNLPKGIYVVKVQVNEKSHTRMVIKK